MRKRRLLNLSQTGDTIVEVLLAIAVVSTVLGGAFVSTNHSLRGAQVSQERGEALKLTEAQLELLKAALKDPLTAPQVLAAVGDFCLNDSLAPRTDGTCSQGPAGTGRYRVALNRSGDTYVASARWDKAGGGLQEQVRITYRAYQP